MIPLNNPRFENLPHVGSFWHFVICCICVFVYLFFCICTFDKCKYSFSYPWTNLFSKIYHMLCLSGTLWYAVFVYLFICFCAFYTCIIFDSPEKSSFQKYTTCLGFLALRHVLYLCNCVFVYLWIRQLVDSFDILGSRAFRKYMVFMV